MMNVSVEERRTMKFWQEYCKLTSILVKVGLVIGAVAICATALLVTLEVILRGFFNTSTLIADEYACYFCVAMTFFGGAMAYRQGSFINVDILYRKFKPGFKKWLDLFLNLIAIAFVIFLITKAFYIMNYSLEGDVRSATISRTPLFIPQGCMFLGLVIFILQMIVSTLDPFITGGANLEQPVPETIPDDSEFESLNVVTDIADKGEINSQANDSAAVERRTKE